jgi:[acyl-carrier-protein] S-malonyltransferase
MLRYTRAPQGCKCFPWAEEPRIRAGLRAKIARARLSRYAVRKDARGTLTVTRAFVFPGQGAQTIGMGRDLAAAFPAARAVFAEVDDALSENLSDLIWNGQADQLQLTQNAQPALMATSIAALRALESEGIAITSAAYVAGHSLGEYTALCAAGALTLPDTARLLRLRGQAMQAAVPLGVGAMAALLGLDFAAAAEVAAEAAQGEVCQAANDNDPAQVVVSGHRGAVERALEIARARGAKRALLLPVSAPFHCALMQPAADAMAAALAGVTLLPPRVPLVANVRAAAVSDPGVIRALLVEQVTGSVRWRESVLWMAAQGVTETWEIGAGKALSGMIRRIAPGITTRAVGSPDDVAAAVAQALNQE